MTNPTMRPEFAAAARERIDVAAVLLTMQSALGLLAALGTFTFAAVSRAVPLFAGAIMIALAGPIITLVLAAGLRRQKRWARNGAIVYETFVLVGAAARFLIGRNLAIQLVPLMTSLVLPAVIAGLVASRPVWRACARRAPHGPIEILNPTPARFERAA